MVQRTGEQGQGNVFFVQNNFYYDAFFLKAIGKSSMSCLFPFANVSYQFSTVAVQVDGVTLRTAAVSMYVLPSSFCVFSYILPQPFGVSYSGATYKYTVLDTTGQRAAAAGI
jgi:integrin alpha FG-GAP repeat containing protein 1